MRHNWKPILLSLFAINTIGVWASPPQAMSDDEFLHKAAAGQQFEITLGKLAATKGSNAFIKSFGKMMVKDHGAALQDLQTLAAKKGKGKLPTQPSKEQSETTATLSKLSGAAFDKAYREHMIEDHKKDLALFQKESTAAKDADVRNFAKKCVPVIKKHLKSLQDWMMKH